MEKFFGPEGLLAEKLDDFEFRPSQLEMAQAVFASLKEGRPLLAEAGTGTGKTWAYLVPAVVSGKRVVVSTGTKTLQDQILDQDVPLLRRLIFPRIHVVCLKGRRNYLCRRRFREFVYQPNLYRKEEARFYARFQKWANTTTTGDRAEIEWLPDRFPAWNEVTCSADQCLGQLCPELPGCFLCRARAAAARAQIVVVNHHLLLADLALRSGGMGEVIPEYDALILDEAHQLEDIAGQYFGVELSSPGLLDFVRELNKESAKDMGKERYPAGVQEIGRQLDVLARRLHQQLHRGTGPQGRYPLDSHAVEGGYSEISHQILHALEQMGALLGPAAQDDAMAESLCRRSLEMARAARLIVEQGDPSLVYWYEWSPQAVFLRGTPVEVGSFLKAGLFQKKPATVLTSATLAVAGSTGYLRRVLGIGEEAVDLLLPSPFALHRQASLYVPLHIPAPNEPGFCREVAEEALGILARTHGRALFLFTSYRHLHEVVQWVGDRIPYPLLVQGQKPKRALLAEFREKVESVLFATSSFWQGVDVPGESLSCLLIDKLPFEVPDDPVFSARMARLAQAGGNPFVDYQVPRAIIQLKQGLGRLIRTSSDRGLVVIFDIRLFTKRYGQTFMRSLPPFKIVHKMEEIDFSFCPKESPSRGLTTSTFS
ncbi:MAG: ATP-dependent DNA helicase [Deltaproteobacteria bacterium]|nr:ATP-dependent DNA helicase [Deltaproteobacteria bacterium]